MSIIQNPSEHKRMSKSITESLVDTRMTPRQVQTIDGLINMPSTERKSIAPIRADGMAIGAPTTMAPSAVRKGMNPKTKRTPGMMYPITQN